MICARLAVTLKSAAASIRALTVLEGLGLLWGRTT